MAKRPASYVPAGFQESLMAMSKADLAEIVWDYAVRTVGEEMPAMVAWHELCRTREILSAWRGRRVPRARP